MLNKNALQPDPGNQSQQTQSEVKAPAHGSQMDAQTQTIPNENIPQSQGVVLQGGPGQEQNSSQNSALTDQTNQTQSVPEQGQNQADPVKPVFEGLKTFNDIKDLAIYTSDLEKKILATEAKIVELTNNATQSAKKKPKEEFISDEPVMSDILFEDPDKAVGMIKESAKNEIRAELNQEKEVEKFWKGFYEENQDLQNFQDIVNIKVNENAKDLEALYKDGKVQEAKAKLTSAVRTRISEMKKNFGVTETEVTSVEAVTTGTSGTPVSSSTPITQPLSFVDQLKKFQQRGQQTA